MRLDPENLMDRFEDLWFHVKDEIRTAFWRMISKIWYRHVVTLTCDMMRELPDASVRMWFAGRPKNSITWTTGTYHGWPAVEWHIAFHRIEDAVMFRLRAL